MQKYSITAAACVALAAGFAAAPAPAAAGPFDSIKKAVKKVDKKKREAEEVVETVERVRQGATGSTRGGFANRGSTSNSPRTARAPGHAGNAGPAPAKYTGQLKCANLGLGNAFVGREGKYTFSQGISTEERTGLTERTNVSAQNGCFFPGLGVGDVLYVEVDKAKYKKYDYKIQCVSYDGSEQLDNVHGPKINNYKGKDVMLHTGNSLGFTPTASGSNSSRSGAYDKYLDGRGRTMITFNFASLHTDKAGTDFYCQWFDKNSGKSALAFTYRRGPAG